MHFAIKEAIDEDDGIHLAPLDREKKAAAQRKAMRRRAFAALMRSIKSMVREAA